MRLAIGKRIIRLEADAPLAFRGARGVLVECVEGTVWLTVEGQAGDFFLRGGEALRIDSDRLALIEGLPQGAVRFIRPARRALVGPGFGWARRLGLLEAAFALCRTRPRGPRQGLLRTIEATDELARVQVGQRAR